MNTLTEEDIKETIAGMRARRAQLKTDPELCQAIINAKDNRAPIDPNRLTPKERYEAWIRGLEEQEHR